MCAYGLQVIELQSMLTMLVSRRLNGKAGKPRIMLCSFCNGPKFREITFFYQAGNPNYFD